MKKIILESVEKQRLKPKNAYKKLFKLKKRRMRRAHFVKMSLKVYESRAASVFLGILFFIPWPIFMISFITRLSTRHLSKEEKINLYETMRYIRYKPFVIQVVNDEVKLKIRTI